jgi:hypothetical protein
MFHQILKQSKFATGVVITFQVMAFAGMSPGYPDAVCPFTQGGKKEFGTHPSGAGNPDHPDIGRIFHPAHAGQIGRAIAAPVAQESHNFWFPIRHVKISPFLDTGYSILDTGFWILVSGCWIIQCSE